MRKLILALFTMCVVCSANAYAADPQFRTWTDKSMMTDKQGTPVRVLKRVRFASNDANAVGIVSGDAVKYDTVSDDGVTVAFATTSKDGAFAGIAVTTIQTADSASASAQDDAGRRNWGWIIVHGPANANVTAAGTNNNAVGAVLITSRDQGKVTTFETPTGSVASLDTAIAAANSGGFFYDAASASDTTVEVFVNLE